MKKVFGIYMGCDYEGGHIKDFVFRDYSKARKQAKELVGVKQKEDEMVYGDEIEEYIDFIDNDCPVHEWEEWREDYWTNGIDNVQVQELKVI